MRKIAFIFPGQGAQYIGMGKDFYENKEVSREIYKIASDAGHLDVAKLCFEENDQINITEYTQIAMATTEIAMLMAIQESGIYADVTAGLSLGEYSAIATAGVMKLEDIFRVVRKRGLFMQQAVPSGGAMAAVLGLDTTTIEAICLNTSGIVSVANYNCPGQTVITGEAEAVYEAMDELQKAGAKKCIPLRVSGPFHSLMLKKAGEQLGEELKTIEMQTPKIPYLANLTADYVQKKEDVAMLLQNQVSSPVKWQQSVERMIADKVNTFIEIGPGKTLSGFLKKMDAQIEILNIEKVEDIDKVRNKLFG